MGRNWQEAGIVLALVPLIVPFRVILFLMAPLTDGMGRPDIGLRNLVTSAALIPLAILIGTSDGLTGVCIALIIAAILAVAINLRRSLGLVELHPRTLFSAVAPTAAAAGVMYVCVWLVKTLVLAGASAPWRLTGSIVTGIAVYSVMTLCINRRVVREFLALVRTKRAELPAQPR